MILISYTQSKADREPISLVLSFRDLACGKITGMNGN